MAKERKRTPREVKYGGPPRNLYMSNNDFAAPLDSVIMTLSAHLDGEQHGDKFIEPRPYVITQQSKWVRADWFDGTVADIIEYPVETVNMAVKRGETTRLRILLLLLRRARVIDDDEFERIMNALPTEGEG